MKQKREELSRVHTNNDAEMVGLRLRRPRVAPRDPSVWTKTEEDRRELNRWRCVKFTLPSRWLAPAQPSGFIGKLVIYLTSTAKSKCFRNVVSHICDRNETDSILRMYRNNAGTKIAKYSWNGKTYQRDEVLPRLSRSGRITA